MSEPAVALSDYALCVETAIFAAVLVRGAGPARLLALLFGLLFASLSAASLLGGTVHGFFLDDASLGHAILWPATLVCIGLTALALWLLGSFIQFRPRIAGRIGLAATIEFLIYAVLVIVTQSFALAVVNYLPAALFFLVVLGIVYAQIREAVILLGLAAGLLTFVASGIQQAGFNLGPISHNVLYHTIEFVAFALLFRTAMWLSRTELPRGRRY